MLEPVNADFVSIACTTFGVCTSLGMGVDIIFTGLRRLDCGRGQSSELRA